jgi:chromosome segregation ATPase
MYHLQSSCNIIRIIHTFCAQCQTLGEQKERLEHVRIEQDRDLKHRDERIAMLEALVTKLKQTISEEKEQSNTIIRDNARLKDDLHKTRTERDTQSREVQRLNGHVDTLTSKVKSQTQEIADQKRCIETLERELQTKVMSIDLIQNESKNNAKKDCEKLNSHIKSINENQKKEVDSLQKREQDLVAKLYDKDVQISNLNNELKRMEQRCEAVKLSLDSLKIKYENEKNELIQEKHMLSHSGTASDESSKRLLVDLENKLLEEQRKCKLQVQELDSMKREVRNLATKAHEFEELSVRLQKELDRSRNEKDFINQQSKIGSSENSNLKLSNDKLVQQKEELEQELVKYLQELEQALETRDKLILQNKEYEKRSNDVIRALEQAKLLHDQKIQQITRDNEESSELLQRKVVAQNGQIETLQKTIVQQESTINENDSAMREMKRKKDDQINQLLKEKVELDARVRIAKLQLDRAIVNRNIPNYLSLLHDQVVEMKKTHIRLKQETLQNLTVFSQSISQIGSIGEPCQLREPTIVLADSQPVFERQQATIAPQVKSISIDESLIMNYESEMAEYKKIVDQLQSEIQLLKQKLLEASESRQSAVQQVEHYVQQLDASTYEYEMKVQQLQHQLSENTGLLEKQNQSFTEIVTSYQDKLSTMVRQFEEEKEQLQSNHDQIMENAKQQLVNQYSLEIKEMKQYISALESKVKEINDSMTMKEEEIIELRDVIDQSKKLSEDELSSLREVHAAATQELYSSFEQRLGQIKEEHQAEMNSKQEIITGMQKEMEVLIVSHQEQQQQIQSEANTRISTVAKQKEDLEQILTSTKQIHEAQLESIKRDYTTLISSMEKDHSEKISQITHLYNEKVGKLEVRLADRENDYNLLADLKNENTKELQQRIESMMDEMRQRIAEGQEALRSKQSELEYLNSLLKDSQNRTQQISEKYLKEIKELEATVESNTKIIERDTQTIAALEVQVSDQHTTMKQMENHHSHTVTQLEEQIRILQESNSNLNGNLETERAVMNEFEKESQQQLLQLRNSLSILQQELDNSQKKLETTCMHFESQIEQLSTEANIKEASYNDQIKAMSIEINNREEIIQNLQNSLKDQTIDFNNSLKQIEEKNLELIANLHIAQSNIDSIKQSAHIDSTDKEQQIVNLDHQLQLTNKEFSTLKEEHAAKVLELCVTRESMDSEIQQLSSTINNFRSNTTELTIQLDKCNSTIDSLQEQLQIVQQESSTQIETLLKEIADNQKTIGEKSTQIEQLVTKHSKDIQEIRKNNEQSSIEIRETYSTQIQTLQIELIEKNEVINNKEIEMEQLIQSHQNAMELIEEKHHDQVESLTEEYNSTLATVRSEMKDMQQSLTQQLISTKEDAQLTIKNQVFQIQTLENQLCELQASFNKKQSEFNQLLDEKKLLHQSLMDQISSLMQKNDDNAENHASQLQLLQKTISSLKEESATAQRKLAQMKQQRANTLGELEAKQERINQLKSEKDNLQETLDGLASIRQTVKEQSKLLKKQDKLLKKGRLMKDDSRERFEEMEQSLKELERDKTLYQNRIHSLECYIVKTERNALNQISEQDLSEQDMTKYIDKLICRRDQHLLQQKLVQERLQKDYESCQQRIRELSREHDKVKKMLNNADIQVETLQRQNEELTKKITERLIAAKHAVVHNHHSPQLVTPKRVSRISMGGADTYSSPEVVNELELSTSKQMKAILQSNRKRKLYQPEMDSPDLKPESIFVSPSDISVEPQAKRMRSTVEPLKSRSINIENSGNVLQPIILNLDVPNTPNGTFLARQLQKLKRRSTGSAEKENATIKSSKSKSTVPKIADLLTSPDSNITKSIDHQPIITNVLSEVPSPLNINIDNAAPAISKKKFRRRTRDSKKQRISSDLQTE